ncbi:hypothetical protein E8E11_001980 [Didymella keratinophila]|nr:hypothetical protein E8E11_001980 [Didymella keratinophila]
MSRSLDFTIFRMKMVGSPSTSVRGPAWRTSQTHGHVTLEFHIEGGLGINTRVNLRPLKRLLYHQDTRYEGTQSCFCYRDVNTEWSQSELKISVVRLRRHLFMHLTQILDTAPLYIKPAMFAVLVDSKFNIHTDEGILFYPPPDEVWTRFTEDPSSTYNKVKERMVRKRKYMGQDCYVESHWYNLGDLLIDAKEPASI